MIEFLHIRWEKYGWPRWPLVTKKKVLCNRSPKDSFDDIEKEKSFKSIRFDEIEEVQIEAADFESGKKLENLVLTLSLVFLPRETIL